MREVKVLIITGKTNVDFRQLPGREPMLTRGERQYHFYLNDESVKPDIVVVRNKYIKHKVRFHIAPENTLLMLSEPRSVVNFPRRYRNQFGMLYSCQAEITHRNITYGPALLPWFVGVVNRDGQSTYSMDYDDFVNSAFPEKTKLLSVITSNKAFTIGHQRRIEFVEKLKERYGDKLDIFGRGFKDFDDKWDVLAPYKYTISIENSSQEYYWTEKLSDCFLAGTYPIYYGAPNAADYFPSESFSTIDISDFEGACKKIDLLLERDAWSQASGALQKAKLQTLDKYNMFCVIADCCDKMDIDLPRKDVVLKPAVTGLDPINLYNQVIERNYLRIRSFLRGGHKKL